MVAVAQVTTVIAAGTEEARLLVMALQPRVSPFHWGKISYRGSGFCSATSYELAAA